MKYTTIKPRAEKIIRERVGKKANPTVIAAGIRKIITHSVAALSNLKNDFGGALATESNQLKTEIFGAIETSIKELSWNAAGRKVYFVDGVDFLNVLTSSNFEMNKGFKIEPFANSFYLSLPEEGESRFSNIHISWYQSVADQKREVAECFLSLFGEGTVYDKYRKSTEEIEQLSEKDLQAIYPDVYNLLHDEFPEMTTKDMLSQQFIEIEYDDNAGDSVTYKLFECQFASILKGDGKHKVTTPSDLASQNILRIVLALSAYKTAGGHLTNGVPNIGAMKRKRFLAGGYNAVAFGLSDELRSYAFQDGHLRGFHFRNLRDERYYQNEHANKVRGSRWAFVKPYWVGTKIAPKTATGLNKAEA